MNSHDGRFLEKTLLAAVLFLVILFGLFPVCNFDVGLHIRTGEYIVKHLSVPKYNLFSCANQNYRMVNDKWLFQVITFLIHRAFGFHGLVLSRILILFGILFLLASVEFKRRHLLSTLAPLFVALLLSSERLYFRPDLASLFFLSLYFFLIMKERKRGGRFTLLVIPIIHILWVNTHGYFLMGLILIALFWGSDALIFLLTRLQKKRLAWERGVKALRQAIEIDEEKIPSRLKTYGLLFSLSVAASFVNPNLHLGAYFPINTLRELMGRSRVLLEGIAEFASPLAYSRHPTNTVLVFPWFVAASLAVFLLFFFSRSLPQMGAAQPPKGRIEAPYFLLFFILLAMSFTMSRNITQLAFLSIPVLSATLNSLTAEWESRSSLYRKWGGPSVRLLFLAAVLFVAVDVVSNRFYFRERSFKVFGSGISTWVLPEKALSFVRKERIRGNAFTSFGIGSYFVYGCYPENLPFIDGNTFGYDIEFFKKYTRVLSGKIPYQEVVEEYNIQFFFLRFFISNENLIQKLLFDPQWKLVYFDGVACIFLKDSAEHRSPIERFGTSPQRIEDMRIERTIHSLDPHRGFFGEITRFLGKVFSIQSRYPLIALNWARFFSLANLQERAIHYYRRAAAENGEAEEGYLYLGQIYGQMGRLLQAERLTRKGVEKNPRSAEGRLILASILNAKGDFREAEEEYEEAIRLHPTWDLGNCEMGKFCLQRGKEREAKKAFLRSVEANPDFFPALFELALFSSRMGEYAQALKYCEDFLRIYSRNGAIHFQAGFCYFKLGKKNEARFHLEKACSLEPDAPFASEARRLLEDLGE